MREPPTDLDQDLTDCHATVPFHLLGLPRTCWRCGRPTTALVGLIADGASTVDDLITCETEPVLALAAAALPEAARQDFTVGEIRQRYSRTAGSRYLSNGCHWCDALLGDHFLYIEQLPVMLAEQGVDRLLKLATVDLTIDDLILLHDHGADWTGTPIAYSGGDDQSC